MSWGAETKDWSPERRLAMSRWMKEHKPWLRSTGPRTKSGKKASSMRWLKHGRRSASVRQGVSLAFAVSNLAREQE